MKPTDNTEQNDRIGPKARVIANSFRRIADESTHELGITGVQSFLLGYLYRQKDHPPCQHDIEVRFNIKHPTATGLLERMEERGFVRFRQDGADRRRKRILLTEKGAEAAESTRQKLDALDRRLTLGFTPQELSTLNALLDRVVANIEPSAGKCRRQEGE